LSTASKVDRAVSIVLTVATLGVVALMVERRFSAPAQSPARVEYVADWRKRLAHAGRPIGPQNKSVTVAVFTDFECPYCRRMDSVLSTLEARFPGRLARQIIHLPISQHKFARPAAFAFECALRGGYAAPMHRELYAAQDSLGAWSWSQFAMRSGLRDTMQFASCMASDGSLALIEAGVQQAAELKIGSTPTVLVNGWRLDPSSPELVEKAVSAAVQGRSPKSVR